jgi:cardiolipin synthase
LQKRKLISLVLLFLYWLLPAQDPSHAVGGNILWSTKNGEEFMDRLLQDVAAAQKTIEIEYYWFATDASGRRMREALIAKAREGVKVRLIMDNLITPFAPESFYDAMRKAGVELYYAHPFEKMDPFSAIGSILGPRDHRKIIVIDGSISYTGGMNFYDDAIYIWKDTQVRVEGPVAGQMWELFAQSWQKFSGQSLVPPSPAPVGTVVADVFGTAGKARLDTTFISLLNRAQKYFYIQTPYYAPPRELVDAFKAAAGRGVDVRILVPDKSDWGFMNELTREHSVELMRAGVGIYVYVGPYDHTKIFVTDDILASCSTINMDYRSLRTNWEDGFYFYDPESILHFKNAFLEEAAQSQLLGTDAQPAKGFRKLLRNFYNMLKPLF